jgi:hypothetical protein
MSGSVAQLGTPVRCGDSGRDDYRHIGLWGRSHSRQKPMA